MVIKILVSVGVGVAIGLSPLRDSGLVKVLLALTGG